MLTANAVTVTKEKDVTWDLVKPNLELVMSQFFSSDMPAFYPDPEEEYFFKAFNHFEKVVLCSCSRAHRLCILIHMMQ